LGGTVLLASTISVEIGLSVALIELAGGVFIGNVFHPEIPDWLSFIGTFAGIVLTFLAGAEVDVPQFRREWRVSLSIGSVSFFAPFFAAGALAYWVLGWTSKQSEIAGIALSTTSLAVVYAVLVETGLNQELVGKRLMSATFVTDSGTVAALSILFIKPNIWILPFIGASVVLIFGLPRIAPWFFARYGDRVIEPEIKLVFASLLALMWLGDRANSQAVLPAFALGLALANHYAEHRQEQVRLRVVAFAFLTPLFFLKGGLNVSLGAVWANLGILALLFAAKMVPKLAGVYPLARRYTAPHAAFTTLLMSTGLTFGTISALYGLNAGIIDRMPTAIAQRFSSRTRNWGGSGTSRRRSSGPSRRLPRPARRSRASASAGGDRSPPAGAGARG
jgi:Kef-type K+ transport system membrane component KefB